MELPKDMHSYTGRLTYFTRLSLLVNQKSYTLREANAMLDEATIDGKPAFEPNVRFRGVGITPDNERVPYRWVNGEWEVENG